MALDGEATARATAAARWRRARGQGRRHRWPEGQWCPRCASGAARARWGWHASCGYAYRPGAAPLPASDSSRTSGAGSLFRRPSGSWPGFPVPLVDRVTLPLPPVRKADATGLTSEGQPGYPPSPAATVDSWISRDSAGRGWTTDAVERDHRRMYRLDPAAVRGGGSAGAASSGTSISDSVRSPERRSRPRGAQDRDRPQTLGFGGQLAPSVVAIVAEGPAPRGRGGRARSSNRLPAGWRRRGRRPSHGPGRARSAAPGRCRSPAHGRPSGRNARRSGRGRRLDAVAFVADRDDRDWPSNQPASSTTRPGGPPNLTALAARFVTICSTRRRSPVAARRRGGADRRRSRPRSSAIGMSPADTA